MSRLQGLQQQRMKLEAVVRQFEKSNEGYIKIRKTVEEKVVSIFSNKRMLLNLATLSLIESMRNDPAEYGCLIDSSGKFFNIATVDYATSQSC